MSFQIELRMENTWGCVTTSLWNSAYYLFLGKIKFFVCLFRAPKTKLELSTHAGGNVDQHWSTVTTYFGVVHTFYIFSFSAFLFGINSGNIPKSLCEGDSEVPCD